MFKKFLGILLALCCLAVCAGAETTSPDYLGTINGDVYENQAFGIGCSLPGWKYASAEDLEVLWQQMIGILPDDLSELIENATNVPVMRAQDATGMYSVNIQIAKQNEDSLAFINTYGMKSFLEAGEEVAVSSFESLGCENIKMVFDEVQISGKDFAGAITTASMQGFPIYLRQAAYVSGEYAVIIAITCFSTDATDDILSQFYVIE